MDPLSRIICIRTLFSSLGYLKEIGILKISFNYPGMDLETFREKETQTAEPITPLEVVQKLVEDRLTQDVEQNFKRQLEWNIKSLLISTKASIETKSPKTEDLIGFFMSSEQIINLLNHHHHKRMSELKEEGNMLDKEPTPQIMSISNLLS